jgi:zinc transport system substrate-binding protein
MKHYSISVLALGLLVVAGPAAAQPKVMASILPLQSLAAGVMAGIGEPATIVRSTGSPHSFSLRPSDARGLNASDVVFWIGPEYETFLAKPLAGLAGKARIVPLLSAAGVKPLPAREGGAWEGHDHGHSHAHKPGAAELDPHVFLDTDNAKAIVRVMADTLRTLDTVNAARYTANAEATVARLDALDAELKSALAPVARVPYVVFHDGYQYVEKRYGLNAVGSVTVSPERTPGARRLGEIRRKIDRLNAACVFAEPQFNNALVGTVLEGTKARRGLLDYIGVDQAPGAEAYFGMMRGLARDLAGCLAG